MGQYRVECAAAQMGFDLKVRLALSGICLRDDDLNPYLD